jgi:hypothetical protein
MRWVHLGRLSVTLSLLVACGGNDGFSAGPDGGVPLEDLPAAYATALCSAYQDCYGDLLSIFRPGEECSKTATVQIEEELATLPHAVESGRIAYDGVAAQACVDEIAAGGCTTLDQRASATCQAVLLGTAKEDEDCELNEDCVAGLYCKLGTTCPGTCAPLEVAGRACSSGSHCQSGLKCGETQLCVAPAKAGAACKQGEPDCAAGFICLGDSAENNRPGECVAIADAFTGAEGDTCSFMQLCESGLSCEISSPALPLSGTCVKKKASGDGCHPSLPDACPVDEYCKIGGNPFDGTCTARPAAGEDCAVGLGGAGLCAPYARCDGGTCRELANAGEGCSQNETCYSGRCEDGACVAGSGCE